MTEQEIDAIARAPHRASDREVKALIAALREAQKGENDAVEVAFASNQELKIANAALREANATIARVRHIVLDRLHDCPMLRGIEAALVSREMPVSDA